MTLNSSVLRKYPNRIFIETGTHTGDGVFMALAAGFQEIHSIEIFEKTYNENIKRFKNHDKNMIKLYLGDSVKVLPQILEKIKQPATFWLDAHYSGLDSNTSHAEDYYCALLHELDVIGTHHIKNHHILIDDRRCMIENKYFDYLSEDQVRERILKINPEYKISYEDGYVKDDIIVAKI